MSAPFQATHDLLGEGTEFVFDGRVGTVFRVRPEGYLVHWHVPSDVGAVEASPLLTHEMVRRANEFGRLVVVRRGDLVPADGPGIPDEQRTANEIRRRNYKDAHCEAAHELIARGEMRYRRADFIAHQLSIAARAAQIELQRARADAGMARKRAGARTGSVLPEHFDPADKGRTVYNWYRAWKANEGRSPFDNYRNGGLAPYHDPDTRAIAQRVVRERLDEERPSIANITSSVKAEIHLENLRRGADPDLALGGMLSMPGYDFVADIIDAEAPMTHLIRKRGLKVAYRDMHSVGIGMRTTRILERVEVDEYTCDLMLILKATGLLKRLTLDEKRMLGLDGKTRRVIISAAIDCFSRCLLAMKIVPEEAASPLRDTVEMIYSDKKAISDAFGCIYTWNQGGKPSSLVLDRGARYVSQAAYDLLSMLGVTNLGAPAGKPWLRPFIERLFETLHATFLNRFSGRTFSTVVARGENDAAARATLTLENFCGWLCRWIVDDYHRAKHAGLMWRTPQEVWDQGLLDHRPQSLTEREMRLFFGERLRRTVRRDGIHIFPVRYFDDAFGKLCMTTPLREMEVAFWQGSAGAIEVRIDRDRWQTVTSADRCWFGKDFSDMLAVREAKRLALSGRDAGRDAFVRDADAESLKLKALRGIAAPSFSKADIERGADDFIRYADNAGRDWDRPEPCDLLAGEVVDGEVASPGGALPPGGDAAPAKAGTTAARSPNARRKPTRIDPSDLME